jgi:hypothetical protein
MGMANRLKKIEVLVGVGKGKPSRLIIYETSVEGVRTLRTDQVLPRTPGVKPTFGKDVVIEIEHIDPEPSED